MSEPSVKDIEDVVLPIAKGGKVALGHLADVCQKLGLELTPEDLSHVMNSNHFHDQDELTMADFQSLVSRVTRARLRERQLLAEFRKHDLNSDGLISRDEARAAINVEGVSLTEDEFDAILKEVDLNGDGKVDYEEFARFASAR